MVKQQLETNGCYFGHLSEINPSLLDEIRKLDIFKNPEYFRRVTHSGSRIHGENEATATNSYEEAKLIKQLHLSTNKKRGLWQTFYTWGADESSSINQTKSEYIPLMSKLFLEIFKYAYNGEMIDDIWEIGEGNINMTHFDKDCFIDDHADGGGKRMICNILIYLNDDWDDSYGGELVINGGLTQQPKFGNFAILDFKTVNPLHSVTPIKSDDFHRYTILTGILYKENFVNTES
jgi:Rps23 Pro-64 3,4-dihydroxylase Tpa1-like proline 4-hydroxylase